MKAIIILLMALSMLKAIILPPEGYYFTYAKITNLDQYPEIVIQRCTSGSLGYEGCRILENDTFFHEYTSTYAYFVMKKELYDKDYVIDEVLFYKLFDRFRTIGKEFKIPYLFSFGNIDENIEKEELYFEITQVNDENIVLEVKKRVLIYKDGRADEITNY
jgi:hypothetical protein